MAVIGPFKGQWAWLSNFAPCQVTYRGATYPSVENAYQASKFSEPPPALLSCSPAQAKRLGRQGVLPSRIEKLATMAQLIESKMRQEPFASLLLATGDEEIVELNYWGDTFWGVSSGRGENHLGKIIMAIRSRLRSNHAQL